MLADELDYVLGVDTHRDEHVMVVVTAPAGTVVAGASALANATKKASPACPPRPRRTAQTPLAAHGDARSTAARTALRTRATAASSPRCP
jgi:hypothetical protein